MVRNTAPNPYTKLEHDDWWHPIDLSGRPDGQVFTAKDINRFRQDGFVVVKGLWPEPRLQQATAEAKAVFPAEDVMAAYKDGRRPRLLSEMPWVKFGERSPDIALNHMTIDERVLGAVAQLIHVDPIDLRLSQSHVIAKYGHQVGEEIEGDQDIHVDYGNNSLMVPPKTVTPEAVACLCYYSDVDQSGGSTHFARANNGELTSYAPENFNPPNFVFGTNNGSAATDTGPRSAKRVALRYQNERPVYYKPGTCIVYRLDAWHRGTPAALGEVRHTHHHVWRRADAPWVNWQSLAPRMSAMPTRYMAHLSVLQRTVLGFAAPGDRYWTEETIDAVGQRYPGMDMNPYRDAL